MTQFNIIYNDKTVQINCEDTDKILDIKKKNNKRTRTKL